MDRDALIKLLCDFFLDEFSEDVWGVSDWLAQGGYDLDAFLEAIDRLAQEMSNDR